MALIGDKYQNNERVVIGVVGTSVAQGFYADNYPLIVRDGNLQITWESSYDTRIQGWLVQSRAFLKERNVASDIYNVSIGGGTLADQITLGNVSFLAGVTPKPDLIMIGCAINDAISTTKWVDIPTYKTQLRQLLNEVVDEGIQPFMLIENDIDPTRYTGPRTDGKTYLDVINACREVAREYRINIWDLYVPTNALIVAAGGAIETGLYFDTVHPNQGGHDFLASEFEAWIERLGSFIQQNPIY